MCPFAAFGVCDTRRFSLVRFQTLHNTHTHIILKEYERFASPRHDSNCSDTKTVRPCDVVHILLKKRVVLFLISQDYDKN